MQVYFDSAIIVKLYVQEANSTLAIQLVNRGNPPYALTQWQTLEVKNTIRLKAFRGEITADEMRRSIAAFDQDISSGRWQRSSYTVSMVESKAEDLSNQYSMTLGCRTLDIIHIAAALVIGSRKFISFDARQAALAREAGLSVEP